jgi:hypothetical protein
MYTHFNVGGTVLCNAQTVWAVRVWLVMSSGTCDCKPLLYGCHPRLQVRLGGTEYGRFGTRVQKQMTKLFFPRIHEALKPVAEANLGMSEEEIDEEGECEVLNAVGV